MLLNIYDLYFFNEIRIVNFFRALISSNNINSGDPSWTLMTTELYSVGNSTKKDEIEWYFPIYIENGCRKERNGVTGRHDFGGSSISISFCNSFLVF